jgi:hypothetical protein
MKRENPPVTDPEELRIVQECKVLGVQVDRLYDFTPLSYRPHKKMNSAIAKMLAMELERVKSKNLRAVIAGAGQDIEFKEIFFPALIRTIKRDKSDFVVQMAINDLGKIASQNDSVVVADLLLNTEIGGSRSLLIPTYVRIARKSGIPVLRKLVQDPETRSYALKELAKLGDATIEADLRELLKHPDSYHRKIARDALKRVEKIKLKSNKPVVN